MAFCDTGGGLSMPRARREAKSGGRGSGQTKHDNRMRTQRVESPAIARLRERMGGLRS